MITRPLAFGCLALILVALPAVAEQPKHFDAFLREPLSVLRSQIERLLMVQ